MFIPPSGHWANRVIVRGHSLISAVTPLGNGAGPGAAHPLT